jgi:5-methylcytosine-specific restriction enzyme subunit McrC
VPRGDKLKRVLTLIEYDSVEYGVVDSPEDEGYDENGKKLYITEKSINQLEKLNETQKFAEIHRKRIKVLNYAGVVKVGNITMEILPKFLAGDVQEVKPRIMANLLEMLKYTGRLNVKEVNFAGLDLKNDFFEIFVHIFAKNLLSLLKIKQDRSYVSRYDELRFVRERIDVRKYGSNPAKLHKIPCTYHERSMDTPINRTLKYTAYLMLRLVESKENYRLLKQIISLLDPVKLTPVSVDFARKIRFNRLNAEFEPFINFCLTFLKGSSLTLQASQVEFFSLMIPMERLFEEFIAEVIRMNPGLVPESVRGEVLIQKRIGYFVIRDGKGHFELRPDVRVEGAERVIIDTKYKLLNEDERNFGVSQQDLYQMYAYCKESGAKKCLLIYPEGLNGEINEGPWGLGSEDIELYVRTVPLTYALTTKPGWSKFIGEMKSILSCLGENDA